MCIRDFVCGLLFGSVIGLTVPPVAAAQTNGIREVNASERSVIPLQTRLRYTTMIVLPDEEENPHASMIVVPCDVSFQNNSNSLAFRRSVLKIWRNRGTAMTVEPVDGPDSHSWNPLTSLMREVEGSRAPRKGGLPR